MIYKYDTHVHTAETSPCGMVRARDLVRLYKNAGFSGIVITDHYYSGFFENLSRITWKEKIEEYLKGYKIAAKEGGKIGLKVILGLELRFLESFNDYLIYGITEDFLFEAGELFSLTLKEFRKLADKEEILIYQAHPFRGITDRFEPVLLDGIEVYNGHPYQMNRNDLAYEYAKINNLKMISGSDFHEVEALGRGGILTDTEVNNYIEFADMLRYNESIQLIRHN
ncbi:MAG: PHP domain-containing protein [Clostridiaceae bacterium]|jgi:predicted metal-dependent phosphoesterase TrpH|nr:PHP domain-containing protein [Clostridiaceae bacterium]